MLPVLMDNMRTNSDNELRSITGLLRNLSRHAKNKGDLGQYLFSTLHTNRMTYVLAYSFCPAHSWVCVCVFVIT